MKLRNCSSTAGQMTDRHARASNQLRDLELKGWTLTCLELLDRVAQRADFRSIPSPRYRQEAERCLSLAARADGGAAMTARNVQSRITKLEARSARPDEMLVVWRLPDGDVFEALKDATFARGDKVICAEWFDDSPPPKPRWYSDELWRAMPPAEYEQISRTIDRVAGNPQAKRDAGFAPFPSITKDRMKMMTDDELTHAVLGVRT